MKTFSPPLDRDAFQRRLASGRQDVQMAHGDYVVCMRDAETLRDLEDVARAITESLLAMTDCQDQCRLRLIAMKWVRGTKTPLPPLSCRGLAPLGRLVTGLYQLDHVARTARLIEPFDTHVRGTGIYVGVSCELEPRSEDPPDGMAAQHEGRLRRGERLMDMTDNGLRLPKPERRAKAKARRDRVQTKIVYTVRMYVFARERHVCRICRLRQAVEMHELRFRSLGGKVSRQNSVAVCLGCHRFAQANEIRFEFLFGDPLWSNGGAEGSIEFTPITVSAAEWLRVRVGESIESAPMVNIETAE